jgi:Protein of unknown function (DUF1329)
LIRQLAEEMRRMFYRSLCSLTLLATLIISAPAAPAAILSLEAIQSSFHPYSASPLRYPGITPGMIIDQHNWQVAEQLLPAEVLHLIQQGDFTITVQETTDLPLRETYITATTEQFAGVSLDSGYRIENYQGGRPFPILHLTDPRAGEKAAWNFHYRDVPDTMEMRGTMEGVNNSGSVDRYNTGRMRIRYGMDRVGEEINDPQWKARGVRMKASFESLAPSDSEGNIRITTFFDDESQPSSDLSYSPQNRRTRKGYVNMLTRMGGGRYDVLQEEQPPFFFSGYIHDYTWTYKGERTMLVPGFLRADHLTFSGKNNWYPNTPWELRKVVVLESTPKGDHPYSKRIFYLDAQTYAPFCVLSYDPQGAFVRLSLIVHGNPDFVPGSNGIRLPVPLGATWVNYSQDHAYRMIADNPTFNRDFSPQRFELMELLRKGK